MTKVRIYQPDKTAMQSGLGNTKSWRLEFEPDSPYFIDPLTGWSGMRDTTRELNLHFPSREAAIAYAEKHRLEYEVFEPHKRAQTRKAYADNFKFKRVE